MLSCVAIRVAFRAIRYELQGAAPVAVRVRISVMLRCVRCHSGCGRAQGPPLHAHTKFRDVSSVMLPFGLRTGTGPAPARPLCISVVFRPLFHNDLLALVDVHALLRGLARQARATDGVPRFIGLRVGLDDAYARGVAVGHVIAIVVADFERHVVGLRARVAVYFLVCENDVCRQACRGGFRCFFVFYVATVPCPFPHVLAIRCRPNLLALAARPCATSVVAALVPCPTGYVTFPVGACRLLEERSNLAVVDSAERWYDMACVFSLDAVYLADVEAF